MNKTYVLAISLCVGCSVTEDYLINLKNSCYDLRLEILKNRPLYIEVHSLFVNDFSQRQASDQSLLNKSIDDAIFFSMDSTKCVLLVLERSDKDIAVRGGFFGSARAYEGSLVGEEWRFKQSIWFTFDNGYFKKYPENSFPNIAKVARHSVLSSGKVDIGDCDIDEAFWFEGE